MSHPIHRIRAFWLRGDYRIEVEFEDRVRRLIDLEPILHGTLFAPLRDQETFRQVRLDPEVATLVWPTGADFDPATLYQWPEVKDAMAEMARSWSGVGSEEWRPVG